MSANDPFEISARALAEHYLRHPGTPEPPVEGMPGTWSHCGLRVSHGPHRHTVVVNEGPHPGVLCMGTPTPEGITPGAQYVPADDPRPADPEALAAWKLRHFAEHYGSRLGMPAEGPEFPCGWCGSQESEEHANHCPSWVSEVADRRQELMAARRLDHEILAEVRQERDRQDGDGEGYQNDHWHRDALVGLAAQTLRDIRALDVREGRI